VDSIVGLDSIPSTVPFDYQSNPTPPQFPGGSMGCVLLSGTPDTGSVGTYPITVHVTVNVSNAIVQNVDQPQAVSGYEIVIDQFNGVRLVDVRKQGLVATPTLTNGLTQLNVFTDTPTKAVLGVLNNLGQLAFTKQLTLNGGVAIEALDLSGLPNGSYVVTLMTGKTLYTTKVLLNK
jgi:hypothetical protein